MALIAPAYETINPSMMLPEIIMPFTQVSGAFDLLPGGEPRVILGEGDLAVYARRMDMRVKMAASQSGGNQLPSADVVVGQISTATYLQQIGTDFNHHDTAAAGRNGFSLVEAMRLATQQGHFQLARTALLFGYNPANGEGLLNSPGATSLNLPMDSFGDTTVVTYDNGAMAQFLLLQVEAIKVRTNNLGIGRKFTILGPQRDLGLWGYSVVQLVQYQRPGSGTSSTSGVVQNILMDNGDEVTWAFDDTLIGKGANGTDMIVICMPEVEQPKRPNWNTNRFADLTPSMTATVAQLCDMAAPREITVPIARGAVDVLSELRLTSGWPIRPEAISLISMQYS